MWDLIAVLALVALAAGWLLRRYWRVARQDEAPCCGGGGGGGGGGCASCGCAGGCGDSGTDLIINRPPEPAGGGKES